MSSNPIVDVLKSNEERQRLLKIEQLRRQGERFIRVRYVGLTVPQIDSEGVCFNVRIHGLKDIEAYEQTNINDGTMEWKGRRGARMLTLNQTSHGDIEADVWDDPERWNRRFLATHENEFLVVDDTLRDEVTAELRHNFNAEPSRKQELETEIADKLRELEEINKKEIIEQKENRKKNKNGLNESASDVDSAGVSRVAAGGARKRDSSSVQSGSQDT